MRIYIFVNGIMSRPGDAENWNGRAVTWTHLHTDDRAEKMEYFCTPIGRAFFQKRRAEKLARLIEQYSHMPVDITLVGHSNGAAIVLEALRLLNWPLIYSLHLVSAACDADFSSNGLNVALHTGTIKLCRIYIGGKDSALRLARTWLGRLLGYGVLGLHGPQNLAGGLLDRNLFITRWPELDHSDCFKPYLFDATMKLFLTELS